MSHILEYTRAKDLELYTYVRPIFKNGFIGKQTFCVIGKVDERKEVVCFHPIKCCLLILKYGDYCYNLIYKK